VKWLCNIIKQIESVERYNLRDFTYVAKDEYWTTHIYKCYVFDMRIHWHKQLQIRDMIYVEI